ncbi:MAG TPA: acyl carrier protein [Amycolatopsis sp.]|uniref:Acyl carrier protein n=1 Tax=Amycolatopsis nalaikhensis TaxID=715472 RepID=A0ABY8XH35_9PSEU|nr:acyl carrier protein [Amycolatopsis sp. 2-2]WIV54924.1 acyl carrier protein [Amycolatopsis sp. 2-2]
MTTPHPDLTTLVRETWARVLGHDRFTDDDHWFSVGGNSLGATRIMAALGRAVGTRLPVRMLFDHQTVATLVAAVSARLEANAA